MTVEIEPGILVRTLATRSLYRIEDDAKRFVSCVRIKLPLK